MKYFGVVIGLALLLAGCAGPQSAGVATTSSADLDSAARRIIEAARTGDGAYKKLERLCDDIGHRISGSPQLTQALEWAAATMKADGHENVRIEPVTVPHWVRGRESLAMIEPRAYDLHMLGLGGSVGTDPGGLTAEVVVVADEAELEAKAAQVPGKIVLFNNPMPKFDPVHGSGYGKTVRFRGRGPQLAAAKGAVACLVRSVTARSLRSPHTGATNYGTATKKIPAAAVSTEDADMLARLTERGTKVRLRLSMDARTEEPAPSGNVVAELRGRELPDEVVVIGGHIDSWDVGQGAHDDGAGCVTSMEAITILRKLQLIPRRTIRVVLYTNEENGLAGGKAYAQTHAAELSKHVAAIETDSGGFRPLGFGVSVGDAARTARAARRLGELLRSLRPIGATHAEEGGGGADISTLAPAGVPMLGLNVEGSTYFDYHHTHADTLDKVDRRDLADGAAAMAFLAYSLAEMPGRLGD